MLHQRVEREIDQLPHLLVHRTEYEALGLQGPFDDEDTESLDRRTCTPPTEDRLAGRLDPSRAAAHESIPDDVGEVHIGNPIALSDLSNGRPNTQGRSQNAPHHVRRGQHDADSDLGTDLPRVVLADTPML